jgi:hypothetical protein
LADRPFHLLQRKLTSTGDFLLQDVASSADDPYYSFDKSLFNLKENIEICFKKLTLPHFWPIGLLVDKRFNPKKRDRLMPIHGACA